MSILRNVDCARCGGMEDTRIARHVPESSPGRASDAGRPSGFRTSRRSVAIRERTRSIRESRGAALKPVSWTEAAAIFCDRMRAILSQHGRESAAYLGTGQICTEEMALLGAFAKFGMGMIHGQHQDERAGSISDEETGFPFGSATLLDGL